MNIRNFDINLLVIFNEFYYTCSVSQTAMNLGLSQPAISHALKRLRISLEDELFIRTGKSYSFTDKADELATFLNTFLGELENTLFKKKIWNPKESNKLFTLSGTSFDSSIWFPRLVEKLSSDAPNLSFTMRGIVYEEFLERMVKGDVDLSFAGNLDSFNNFTIETLGELGFCLICKKSSRKFTKNISLKTYLEADHILFTPTEKPGSFVDKILADLGHKRRISIRTSYLNSIPLLISKTNSLSIVPRSFAISQAKYFDIKIINIPFEIPAFKHQMVWHKSRDNSSAHQWLRSYIRDNYSKLTLI